MGAATTRPTPDVGMITDGLWPDSGSDESGSATDGASSGTADSGKAGPPLALPFHGARLASPSHGAQRRAEISTEFHIRLTRSGWQHTHHHIGAGRETSEFRPDQMAQPAPHLVAGHRRADRLGNDKPDPR